MVAACGLATGGLGSTIGAEGGVAVDAADVSVGSDASTHDVVDAHPQPVDATDGNAPRDSANDAPPDACASCGVQAVCVGGVCTQARRVFLSEYGHDGTLGNGTGTASGDTTCQLRASMAGLGGTFMAWVSDTQHAASSRLAHAAVGYYLLDGTQVASDWNGLASGSLLHPIDINAYGITKSGVTVWTGTQPNGGSALPNCADFTTNMGLAAGVYGDNTKMDGNWSNAGSGGCDQNRYLYCIEQ
jgi:hypothetical protein